MALLVDFGDGKQLWIPVSQIKCKHGVGDPGGQMEISEWIAKQKGL